MNFKKLGNTDIDVSTICLGTMTWGEQNSEKDAFEQMDYAFEKNVNFWDTAEIYAIPPKESTYGKTEEIIGNWFTKTKKRNRIVLATKVSGPGPGGGCIQLVELLMLKKPCLIPGARLSALLITWLDWLP